MPSPSPRLAAAEILARFERLPKSRSLLKADPLVNDVLAGPGRAWSAADRGLFTMLVYGVLRQWVFLDFLIGALSHAPREKIQPKVRTLLRLGLFQLQCLDHVPDHAALHATVELAKALKLSQKSVGFINGLLREFQRRKAADALPKSPSLAEDPVAYLSVAASLPPWLIERWMAQCGLETTQAMAQSTQGIPTLCIRVNTLVMSLPQYVQSLTEAGVSYTQPEPEVLPECLLLVDFHGSPTGLPGYEAGHFYVQDLNSARVALAVAPQPGETVVDLCAAPGSKAMHLAALMKGEGRLWAVDSVPARLETLHQNAARLRIPENFLRVVAADGLTFSLPEGERAQRVLVDAPCSGLGTLRRHPELALQMSPSKIAAFPKTQLALLRHAARLLGPGGVLVYSTCSTDSVENQDVTQAFLAAHPEMTLLEAATHPLTPKTDGFYIARFQRQ